MNQGDSADFARGDGVWQDGGLLVHSPAAWQWVAVFLAFQSQVWHTDDVTGHALPGPAPKRETETLIDPGVAPVDLAGWSLVDRQARVLEFDAQVIAPG